MTKDEILEYCSQHIQKITTNDMQEVNAQREEALRFFFSDQNIVPTVDKRSKYTTTDLADTAAWVLPSLLKIFAGNDEVVDLVPREQSDTQGVEDMQELLNHQMRIKNKWFLMLNDFFMDCMLLKTGWIKYQWVEIEDYIKKTFEDLDEDQRTMILSQPNVELVEEKQVETQAAQLDAEGNELQPPSSTTTLIVKYVTKDEYPLLECVPSEEIGYYVNMRDIDSYKFMFHLCRKQAWEIRKLYGDEIFEKIEKNFSIDTNQTMDNVTRERYKDLNYVYDPSVYDIQTEEFLFHECYFRNQDTGEHWTAIVCGNTLIDEWENDAYQGPPLVCGNSYKLAHRITGRSFHDVMKELMKIRTAFLRQALDNIYFNNNGRYLVDPLRCKMDDFLNNNRPGGVIRGASDSVQMLNAPPIQPQMFQLFEIFQQEKDYHSGVPRSFQGVNDNVLNKTWRGQSQQVSLAQQRIELIARMFAEQTFTPLIKALMRLNIKFLKKPQALRVLNHEWKEVSPDNITNQADIIVNVGIGTGNKDQIILYMQQLMGIYAQIKKAGLSIVSEQNAYQALKELVKAMGFRNVDDFCTNPQLTQTIQQLVMLLIQHAQQMMQSGMSIDPQLQQLVMKVMQGIGMQLPQGRQKLDGRDVQKQTQPVEHPMGPRQPMQPSLLGQGGGYFG